MQVQIGDQIFARTPGVARTNAAAVVIAPQWCAIARHHQKNRNEDSELRLDRQQAEQDPAKTGRRSRASSPPIMRAAVKNRSAAIDVHDRAARDQQHKFDGPALGGGGGNEQRKTHQPR